MLVKQTLGLFVQGAVDGDNVTLSEHFLQLVLSRTSDLLLIFLGQGLVVKVEKFAAKWLEALQHPLPDASDAHSPDHLFLEVVLVGAHGAHVPLATFDLLVGRHEVADEDEHGHDDVLGHGNDVTARHLGHGDAAVCLVGGVEVDVIGPDAGRHRQLELLGLGQTLGGQVAGVEAGEAGQAILARWSGTGLTGL